MDASELTAALGKILAAGPVEVYEDGELLAELAGFQHEVRREGSRLLVHLWTGRRNLARTVLRVAEDSPHRVVWEVQRFGRSRPGRLEFVAADAAPESGRMARVAFRSRFRQLLAEQFPDEQVENLTCATDLEHSFSGAYVRGTVRRGQQIWAVTAVSEEEDAAVVDDILTCGLLWLDWTRQHARGVVGGLRLFLPSGRSAVTAHRLQALRPRARVELYETLPATGRARSLDPADCGNVDTWLTPRREVEQTLWAAGETTARVVPLLAEGIDAVVPPGTCNVAYRLRGLEFARWRNGQVSWGLGDARRELQEADWGAFRQFVFDLDRRRHPLARDRNDPVYRAQAERWLESRVLANPSRLDARLNPQYLYPQVPAFSAGDRGVIDLLGVTRDGRLVVIELKADEDLRLPLQALDYWLRVWRHHRQDDFPRYGYFPDVALQPNPPLLYLVAPSLRFHPTTDTLLRFFPPEAEVVRIGLAEDWRRDLQVVFRQ